MSLVLPGPGLNSPPGRPPSQDWSQCWGSAAAAAAGGERLAYCNVAAHRTLHRTPLHQRVNDCRLRGLGIAGEVRVRIYNTLPEALHCKRMEEVLLCSHRGKLGRVGGCQFRGQPLQWSGLQSPHQGEITSKVDGEMK